MKHYLDVSYEDRDLAKRLGARWDPSVKRWYCPANSPLAKIFTWRKAAQADRKSSQIKNSIGRDEIVHQFSGKTTVPRSVKTVKPPQPTAKTQNLELFIAA